MLRIPRRMRGGTRPGRLGDAPRVSCGIAPTEAQQAWPLAPLPTSPRRARFAVSGTDGPSGVLGSAGADWTRFPSIRLACPAQLLGAWKLWRTARRARCPPRGLRRHPAATTPQWRPGPGATGRTDGSFHTTRTRNLHYRDRVLLPALQPAADKHGYTPQAPSLFWLALGADGHGPDISVTAALAAASATPSMPTLPPSPFPCFFFSRLFPSATGSRSYQKHPG